MRVLRRAMIAPKSDWGLFPLTKTTIRHTGRQRNTILVLPTITTYWAFPLGLAPSAPSAYNGAMTYSENIAACFARATADDNAAGMVWYNEAHNLALELSPNNVWRGAGVIAALSPLKTWNLNVRLARNAFDTGIVSGHISIHTAYAQRILDGEHPLDVMRGDKTRNFATAIATNGKANIATIDRHAFDIAMNQVFTDKTRKIGKRIYRDMAAAYSVAANEAGISVNQIQAITWITWRREKGIK